MPMTKPTSEQVTFLAAGTGAQQRTALDKMRETVSVKDFGAVGDGVADDSGAVEAAINVALAGGRHVYFPSGRYRIGTAKQFVYTGDLHLYGDEATIVMASGTPVCMGFMPPLASTITLTSSVNDGEKSIDVSSASGLEPGHVLFFNTSTPVDSAWGYVKRSLVRVGQVVGNTVYLSEPLNFGFTSAETTITSFPYASLKINGVNIEQASERRFDFALLQQCELSNVTIKGYAQHIGNVVLFNQCYGVTGTQLTIINGLYAIALSNGTRYVRFDNIMATNAWHPFDVNLWAFDVRISNMRAVNVQSSIQCHPSFEVYYEDVTEHLRSAAANNLVLRCIGGGARRCTSICTNDNVGTAAHGAPLLPAYQYLGQKYDRIYDQVTAPGAVLSGQDVRRIVVQSCNVRNVSVDGLSSRIGSISVDGSTLVADPLSLQRVPVLSPDGQMFLESPPETFASIDVIKDITGITKANPAVVTAVAHGYSNGDLIRIDGVTGMTEVNKRTFTIANVATDTFELAGENSTAYAAYVSGGKATKGRLAKTFDPKYVPGCGWKPTFTGRMRLRKTGAQISPLTALTIPVKIVNSMSTEEEPTRQTSITLRAVSSTRGCAAAVYQAYFFMATATVGTLSSAQAFLPSTGTLTVSISNFRPHYATQVINEGGVAGSAGANSENYYSFDLIVTATATSDRIQYVDVEFDEVRTGQLT